MADDGMSVMCMPLIACAWVSGMALHTVLGRSAAGPCAECQRAGVSCQPLLLLGKNRQLTCKRCIF